MLDGGDHEVADLISSDPGRGCHEAHGFAVAAVQREGDAHAFAIIAGHLEAVGTPSQVRLGDGDAAVVATLGPRKLLPLPSNKKRARACAPGPPSQIAALVGLAPYSG